MVRVTSDYGTKAESEKRKKSAKLENDGLRVSFGTKRRSKVSESDHSGTPIHTKQSSIEQRSLSGRENSDVAKKSRKRTKSAVESDNDKPAVLSKNRPTEYAETSINKSAVRPKKIRFDENGDPIPVLSDQAIGGFERVSGTAYEKEALLELCNGEGSDSRTASKKLKRKKNKKVEESQKTKILPKKLNAEFAGTSTNMRPKKIRFDEYGNPIPVKSGQEVSNKIVSGNDYVPGALLKFLNGEESDFMEGIKKAKRKEDVKSKKYQSAEVLSKKLATEDVGISADEKVLQPQLDRSHGSRDPASLKSDEGTSSGMKKTGKKEPSMDEKARTIFVGNAPLSSSRKHIKKLFSKFGTIESVRLRSVITADKKTSKKVAVLKQSFSNKMKSLTFYVKFKDQKSAVDALVMNGEKLDGNMLRVDSCCGHRRYSCQTTVFVGNLPLDVSENELTEHFEACGDVSFVRIVRDANTGNGKGFAFVAFKESAAVPAALGLDQSTFKKRQLRVSRVQKKNKRMNGKKSHGVAGRRKRPLGNGASGRFPRKHHAPKRKARHAGNSVMT